MRPGDIVVFNTTAPAYGLPDDTIAGKTLFSIKNVDEYSGEVVLDNRLEWAVRPEDLTVVPVEQLIGCRLRDYFGVVHSVVCNMAGHVLLQVVEGKTKEFVRLPQTLYTAVVPVLRWEGSDSGKSYPPDVLGAVLEFYVIEAADVLIRRDRLNPFSRAQQNMLARFETYKADYARALAARMFDYLALACWGEARHAYRHADQYVPEVPEGGGRTSAARYAQRYDPKKFLPVLSELFHDSRWDSDYGGDKWGLIADEAQSYWQLPPTAFVDHVVDLAHNGSVCWDKDDYGLFLLNDACQFKYFLNYKAVAAPARMLAECAASAKLVALLQPLADAGLFDGPMPTVREQATGNARKVLGYTPIEWGGWEVSAPCAGEDRQECYYCSEWAVMEVDYHPVCEHHLHEMCSRCDNCGEWTLDKNIIVTKEGDNLCKDCIEECNTCDSCGEYTSTPYEVEDRILCKECYDDLYECQECGERFLGEPTWIDGDPYCHDCGSEKMREAM